MFHGHFVPLMKRFSIPDVSYFVPLSHSYRNNFREELGMIACSGSWSLYREGPVGGATRPNRFVFLHSPLVGANAIKSIKQPGQGGLEVMMMKASSSPSVCDAVGVAKATGPVLLCHRPRVVMPTLGPHWGHRPDSPGRLWSVQLLRSCRRRSTRKMRSVFLRLSSMWPSGACERRLRLTP